MVCGLSCVDDQVEIHVVWGTDCPYCACVTQMCVFQITELFPDGALPVPHGSAGGPPLSHNDAADGGGGGGGGNGWDGCNDHHHYHHRHWHYHC